MDCVDALARQGLRPTMALPDTLRPTAWGQQDRRWVFVFEPADASTLPVALEEVRRFVNAQYWVPRPMRLRAPYMAVVGVTEFPDPALDQVVRESLTRTALGGESFHLIAVTRSTRSVVLPEPKGNRTAQRIEHMGLRMHRPDLVAAAILG